MFDVPQKSELGESGSECSWRPVSFCGFPVDQRPECAGCPVGMSPLP